LQTAPAGQRINRTTQREQEEEEEDCPVKRADAEEYTESLGYILAGGWRQIYLAEKLGVPKALGLSVRDWVEDHLGGYIRLTLPEGREAVAELTALGMSSRRVADVLGVGKSTVDRDLHAVPNRTPEGEDEAVPVPNELPEVTPADAKAAEAVVKSFTRPLIKAANGFTAMGILEHLDQVLEDLAKSHDAGIPRDILRQIEDKIAAIAHELEIAKAMEELEEEEG